MKKGKNVETQVQALMNAEVAFYAAVGAIETMRNFGISLSDWVELMDSTIQMSFTS